jgi:hypothetical protein
MLWSTENTLGVVMKVLRHFLASRLALIVASIGLALAVPGLCKAGKIGDPETYFGTINELEGEQVNQLRSVLISIGEECIKLEKKCPAGDELFALFSGNFNLASQPIHVIYIDQDNMIRTNVLLHKHRVTPFMHGERNVWVVVFAENPLDLRAELTTLWRQKKGTLSNLDGVFVSEGRKTTEAREAQAEGDELIFDRLSGTGVGDDLYYSMGRFFLEPLGVYSTSVYPIEKQGEAKAGFVEARANFSNSMGRSLDLGLALGATLRTEDIDQEVLNGVSVGYANLNLYLMVDIYIIKPTVLKPMVQSFWGRYRPSIGIALGTNLKFWDAQEINVGVSLGHLVGRHGLVFGINIIDSPSDPTAPAGTENSDDRLIRPYIAGLFKF